LDSSTYTCALEESLFIIATPGHTPGSSCFLWPDRLLTGDTLLIGGCGRSGFQQGDSGYKGRRVSTVAEEKSTNPRFAAKTRDQFIEIMNNLDLPMPGNIGEAVSANLRCDKVDG
jgi:sulfur dioxygenase